MKISKALVFLFSILIAAELFQSCRSSDDDPSPSVETRQPSLDPTQAPAPSGTSPSPSAARTPLAPDPIEFSGAFPAASGNHSVILRVAGSDRSMSVYVPSSRGSSPALMIAFHGTGGSGPDMMGESGARDLAQSSAVSGAGGLIVVSPTARDLNGDWDHPDWATTYWETHPNVSADTNPDLQMVRAIVVAAHRAYQVNLSRVYLIGHSNGAFFTLLAAMALHDRVAAFATNSGGLVRCSFTTSCTFSSLNGTTCEALRARPGYCSCTGEDKPASIVRSERKPPAFLAHGSYDSIVSPYYTCTLDQELRNAGYTVSLNLRDGSDATHALPPDFAAQAWPFLSRFSLESGF